jgi:hypothetical protein
MHVMQALGGDVVQTIPGVKYTCSVSSGKWCQSTTSAVAGTEDLHTSSSTSQSLPMFLCLLG